VSRRTALALLVFPVCLAAQLRLEDLERRALDKHPALSQAEAAKRAAEGRRRQAGAYPNPVIGATGDEIAPGPVIRYGEWGGFVEQRIVTGGKRAVSRGLAEQDVVMAEASADAQRYRILTSVRSLFYQALGDQQLVETRTELAKITREAVQISRELANVGQADRTDVLASEIEAQRAELSLQMAQNARERTWRQLAAATNDGSLRPAPLAGDLEKIERLDLAAAMDRIEKESPELRLAQTGIMRSGLAVRQARIARIPDVVARGGLRYNRELLELNARPVGREGFFDVGVEIPLFDRNTGAIAAARAEQERAQLQVDRIRLSLRARLAEAYRAYQDSAQAAELYREQMLPRARQAFDLYQTSFRQMAAAYPQVLIAQRSLFQLREEYIAALVGAWRSAVEIQGFLTSDMSDSAP